MSKKKPFDKEQTAKISFSELVELIGTSCDYRFCIVDDNIDDYVEEIRTGRKSLAFHTLYKRTKNPSE